jgi:hypothetical protein
MLGVAVRKMHRFLQEMGDRPFIIAKQVFQTNTSEYMITTKATRKTCETCTFWEGTPSAYLACCSHSRNRPVRVPFDYTCALHQVRQPILSMQSLVRGNYAP